MKDDDRLFLALDTSTSQGSVAVGQGGHVLGRTVLERQGEHAARLVPAVQSALESAGVDLAELGGVVVGAGPGSFTGVRVAAATAKGLCHALGVPLWAFSSLAAGAATVDVLAAEAERRPAQPTVLPTTGLDAFARCVLFDARADRVYAACYLFREQGLPARLIEPTATTLSGILETVRALDTDVAFIGDGAQRHQEQIQDAGFPLLGHPAGEPTADGLLHLLALDPGRPPLEQPGRWEPDYLRASNAEREPDP